MVSSEVDMTNVDVNTDQTHTVFPTNVCSCGCGKRVQRDGTGTALRDHWAGRERFFATNECWDSMDHDDPE